jgi:predicted  nucleic acid-binding Zn-ribbon protein
MSPNKNNSIKESFDSFRAEINELLREIRVLKNENLQLSKKVKHLSDIEDKAQETIIEPNNTLIRLKTDPKVVSTKEKFDMAYFLGTKNEM